MNDQHRAFHKLSLYTRQFAGATVLEVGGNETPASTEPFVAEGSLVTVTGMGHIAQDRITETGVRVVRADGRNLLSTFEPNTFDIVYGLAVVEHICNPDVFLQQVTALLRPGGFAFFDGSPFWSSDIGHHLWVFDWKEKTSRTYRFDDRQMNPIPPWGHLIMSAEELLEYLLTVRSVPAFDAEKIVDNVYYSGDINRLSAREIATAYSSSPLCVREAVMFYSSPEDSVRSCLERKYGKGIGFDLRGGHYILQKTI